MSWAYVVTSVSISLLYSRTLNYPSLPLLSLDIWNPSAPSVLGAVRAERKPCPQPWSCTCALPASHPDPLVHASTSTRNATLPPASASVPTVEFIGTRGMRAHGQVLGLRVSGLCIVKRRRMGLS